MTTHIHFAKIVLCLFPCSLVLFFSLEVSITSISIKITWRRWVGWAFLHFSLGFSFSFVTKKEKLKSFSFFVTNEKEKPKEKCRNAQPTQRLHVILIEIEVIETSNEKNKTKEQGNKHRTILAKCMWVVIV